MKSNCCSATIKNQDVCCACGEHCEPIQEELLEVEENQPEEMVEEGDGSFYRDPQDE